MAPLLCGGQTVWTPLNEQTKSTDRVGILGLGVSATWLSIAKRPDVTAISSSASKRDAALARRQQIPRAHRRRRDGRRRGHPRLHLGHDRHEQRGRFRQILPLLRPRGTICFVGMCPPISADVFTLGFTMNNITTSNTGGKKDRSKCSISAPSTPRASVAVTPLSRSTRRRRAPIRRLPLPPRPQQRRLTTPSPRLRLHLRLPFALTSCNYYLTAVALSRSLSLAATNTSEETIPPFTTHESPSTTRECINPIIDAPDHHRRARLPRHTSPRARYRPPPRTRRFFVSFASSPRAREGCARMMTAPTPITRERAREGRDDRRRHRTTSRVFVHQTRVHASVQAHDGRERVEEGEEDGQAMPRCTANRSAAERDAGRSSRSVSAGGVHGAIGGA